jgi:hypothetical protein
MINANDFVSRGASVQSNSGETSWPSQVNKEGIAPPGSKLELVSRIFISSLGLAVASSIF